MYHLGERSVRIREVESSNLFRSTKTRSQDLSPAVWFLFMKVNNCHSRPQLPAKKRGRLFLFESAEVIWRTGCTEWLLPNQPAEDML